VCCVDEFGKMLNEHQVRFCFRIIADTLNLNPKLELLLLAS
jgi:hypothetical protein